MKAAAAAIVIASIAGSCARSPEERSAPPRLIASVADPPERQVPRSPWQERCAEWLAGALRVASKKEKEFGRAWVQHETTDLPGGKRREKVLISMFPPIYDTGGFMIMVERGPSQGEHDASTGGRWVFWAESLHGGYHAMIRKHVDDIEAGISFDGWTSDRVREIAPIFQAAADHCWPDTPDAGP